MRPSLFVLSVLSRCASPAAAGDIQFWLGGSHGEMTYTIDGWLEPDEPETQYESAEQGVERLMDTSLEAIRGLSAAAASAQLSSSTPFTGHAAVGLMEPSVGGGVAYRLSEEFSLELDAEYFDTGDMPNNKYTHQSAGSYPSVQEVEEVRATVGFSYHF